MAVMASNFGFEQFLASSTKALERACLIAFHQGGVAHDIGSENGRKLGSIWLTWPRSIIGLVTLK